MNVLELQKIIIKNIKMKIQNNSYKIFIYKIILATLHMEERMI